MKLAICDDEARWQEEALACVEQYKAKYPNIPIAVQVFSQPEALLKAAAENGGFDICILDIVMPGINGIDLAKQLRAGGWEGKILYLTSSPEYAVESYRVKAHNYLLKPLDPALFLEALDEAVKSMAAAAPKSTLVKTRDGTVRLAYDSILYTQIARRAVVYHMIGGQTVESMTLRVSFQEAMAELTADSRFVLCGQSMAANLQHLVMVENEALVFDDGTRTYLGQKLCRELRSVWTDYWFNREAGL